MISSPILTLDTQDMPYVWRCEGRGVFGNRYICHKFINDNWEVDESERIVVHTSATELPESVHIEIYRRGTEIRWRYVDNKRKHGGMYWNAASDLRWIEMSTGESICAEWYIQIEIVEGEQYV